MKKYPYSLIVFLVMITSIVSCTAERTISPTVPVATATTADTPEATASVLPTETPESLATATPSPVIVSEPVDTETAVTPTQEISNCTPNTTWLLYTVQSGDTLFNIASRAGSTVDALMTANCLSSHAIMAGTQLRVPQLPSTMTPEPLATSTATLTATQMPTSTSTNTPTPTPTDDTNGTCDPADPSCDDGDIEG